MECPRLPVRRVGAARRGETREKQEGVVFGRASLQDSAGGFPADREERKPSPGSPGHGQFASFNRTRLLDDGQAVSHRCLLPF